jgi:hypothetical protein
MSDEKRIPRSRAQRHPPASVRNFRRDGDIMTKRIAGDLAHHRQMKIDYAFSAVTAALGRRE